MTMLPILKWRFDDWARRVYLLAIGGIYPLGFAPFEYWPIVIISLLLFLERLIDSLSTKNNSRIFKSKSTTLSPFQVGFYWALGAYGVGMSWVFVSIHEHGHVPVIGATLITTLLIVVLALMKAVCCKGLDVLVKTLGGRLLPILIPFVWSLSEFIQTYFLNGFPWLFVGYSQIDGPLASLATWLGVYGVSWFMLASLSAGLLLTMLLLKTSASQILLANISPAKLVLYLFVFLLFPLLSFVLEPQAIEPNKKALKVALVQPNIAQSQKWNRRYFSHIMDVLYHESEKSWQSDLIVWPEGAIPAYKHQVEDILHDLQARATQNHSELLLGIPVYDAQNETSFVGFTSLGAHQQTYHKQVLVPFGEYVPLGDWFRGIVEFMDLPMSNFAPAKAPQMPMQMAGYQVIPAICYEIAYPSILHRLLSHSDETSDQPKLLVTVSNDAWFGDSFGPYQHMQMARMRALELGIPLVRSTNDGITAVVNAKGKQLTELPRYQQGTLNFELPLTGYDTVYRSIGLYGIYLILLLSGIILIVERLKKP